MRSVSWHRTTPKCLTVAKPFVAPRAPPTTLRGQRGGPIGASLARLACVPRSRMVPQGRFGTTMTTRASPQPKQTKQIAPHACAAGFCKDSEAGQRPYEAGMQPTDPPQGLGTVVAQVALPPRPVGLPRQPCGSAYVQHGRANGVLGVAGMPVCGTPASTIWPPRALRQIVPGGSLRHPTAKPAHTLGNGRITAAGPQSARSATTPRKGHKAWASDGGSGGPRRIRTPDPLIRSQVLYPAELSVRNGMSRAAAVCLQGESPSARPPCRGGWAR